MLAQRETFGLPWIEAMNVHNAFLFSENAFQGAAENTISKLLNLFEKIILTCFQVIGTIHRL